MIRRIQKNIRRKERQNMSLWDYVVVSLVVSVLGAFAFWLIAPMVGRETIKAKIISHTVQSKNIQPCVTSGKNSCLERKKFDILYCEIKTAQETFGAAETICQQIADGQEREFDVRGIWTPITQRTLTKLHDRP